MFNCSYCQTPTGPRISPIKVVIETERVLYPGVGMNEDGDPYPDGVGFQTIQEVNQCQTCAGIALPKVEKPSYVTLRLAGQGKINHARACNKSMGECKPCQLVAGFFKGLSAPAISEVLRDSVAVGLRTSLASVAVENLITKSTWVSKRAKSDHLVAFSILKGFEQRGGGL